MKGGAPGGTRSGSGCSARNLYAIGLPFINAIGGGYSVPSAICKRPCAASSLISRSRFLMYGVPTVTKGLDVTSAGYS